MRALVCDLLWPLVLQLARIKTLETNSHECTHRPCSNSLCGLGFLKKYLDRGGK